MNRKKILILVVAFLGLFVAYLLAAHHYIYYVIGQGNLVATDNRHFYTVGQDIASSSLRYVVLGDSLTAGVGTDKFEEAYPFLVADLLASSSGAKILIENFSYPGARTENLINDLLEPAIATRPDIVTVLIGVNDVHGLIGVSEFRRNYDLILQRLVRETEAKIYAISFPRIGSDSLLPFPYGLYFSWKTKTYNAIIKELAEKYKVGFVDLATSTDTLLKKDGPHYTVDKFHPSAIGYQPWAQVIYDGINQ